MKSQAIVNAQAANLPTATINQKQNWTIKSNRICLFALAVTMLFAALSQTAHAAGPLSPVQLAMEVMMHAQGEDAAFIAGQIGVDPQSPLSYSSYVDPAGQTFNFSLKAGSTYLGQPLSLSASGALNPSTQTWNVSSSASYGGARWNVTSSLVPALSPNASTLTFTSTSLFTSSGLGNDIQLWNGIYCQPAFGYDGYGWSEEWCYLTWNGQPIGQGWLASDGYGNWGWWNWYWVANLVPYNFSLSGQGSTPTGGGAGSFSATVAPAHAACVGCSTTNGGGNN